MSIERIVCPIGERDLTMRSLESTTRFGVELRRFALEFCHAFGVRVGVLPLINKPDASSVRTRLTVFTPKNVPCGEIAICEDSAGIFYAYKGGAVSKEKASGRAPKDTRESSKIQSLITAIKRNNEGPREEIFISSNTHGIACAMNAITYGSNVPRVDIGRDIVDELVKHFLGQPSAVAGFRGDIEEAYQAYRAKIEANSETLATAKRFAEGYRAIGILRPDYNHESVYVVADGATVGDTCKITIDKVVENFSDDPELAAAAMMVRTYIEPKRGKQPNLFGIGHGDHYYSEIDIATGYVRSDCLWVLLPKRHG